MFLRATFFAVVLFTSISHGRGNVDFTIHQQYVTPRAMGMGNTFSGVDDYNVLFYNPAMLARLEEGEVNMGIQIGATPKIIDFYNDIDEAAGKSDEDEQIEEMSDVLSDYYGENFGIRGPLLNFIWARPHWGIGLIPLDPSINLAIHQAGAPALGVSAIQDSTLAYGYAWNLNDQGSFNLGVTAKAIYRASVSQSYTALDLADDDEVFREEDVSEGLLLDFDLGLAYTPEIAKEGFFSFLRYAQPTFGLVVRNALDDVGYINNYHLYSEDSDEDEKPELLQRRVDIGSKWEFPQWWVFNSRLMVDVRDIGHRYWSWLKGLHTGFEANWQLASWFRGGWRAGISQGYFTAGFTGEFVIFNLDLTTYGEEIGTTEARKENRIYMAKLAVDF